MCADMSGEVGDVHAGVGIGVRVGVLVLDLLKDVDNDVVPCLNM